MSSYFHFNYKFGDTLGIQFKEIYIYLYDLLIYYGDGGSDYIDCKCRRWIMDDDNIIIETSLNKVDLSTLMSNITPGAVDEMYNILGKQHYYDSTFTSDNTLRFKPTEIPEEMPNSTLRRMREEVSGYVSNFTTFDITEDLIGVILECKVAD